MPPAIVLVSGGLDSATTLAIARGESEMPIALTFRYGQRHAVEVAAAARVAAAFQVCEHRFLDLDLRAIGGSALTGDMPVPKDRLLSSWEIPPTYVPARNTIFLSFGLALAEVRGASSIYIGINACDYSGYPDCRPDYVVAFERLAALATRAAVQGRPVQIRAPLLHLRKTEIIQRGLDLGVDFGLTRSCYDPDEGGRACGHCDSCRIRLAAFAQLGIADPAPYQSS